MTYQRTPGAPPASGVAVPGPQGPQGPQGPVGPPGPTADPDSIDLPDLVVLYQNAKA